MLDVFYDDFKLTDYFVVRRIAPSLSAPVSNSFITNDNQSGSKYKKSRLGQIKLSIDITIKDDIRHNLDELNKILYTREPKKLVISDQPDRYLLCKLEGEVKFTSRFIATDATLTFVSPYHYWLSTSGEKVFNRDVFGEIEITNNGTAPTYPTFDVRFPSECGYFGLVSPNGFLALGNPKELDKIPVPRSEFAINDALTNLNGWSKVSNIKQYTPDYKAISSAGTAGHDQWGMIINKSSFNNQVNKWQGHAYIKDFSQGTVEAVANNFKLRVNAHMQDTSGTTNNLCAMLVIVLDEQGKPIMTTSVYDASTDRNSLVTSFKINAFKANNKESTIIHNGSLGSLIGHIEMTKIGNRFEWLIHSDAQSQVVNTSASLAVGDTVYIKDSARIGYDWDHSQHNVLGFTRGRPYQISASRNATHGKQHRIDYKGTPVYWMYEWDLQHNKVSQKVIPGGGTIRHSITHDGLAQLKPHKVMIWQGVWGASNPYTRFGVHHCKVERIYTTNALEVENVFREGDTLRIDNSKGEILHNGTTFRGLVDYDSKFFDVDYGKTSVQVTKSNWAQLPEVKATIKERYL